MKSRYGRLFRLSQIGLIALIASQTYAAGYKLEFESTSVIADQGNAAVMMLVQIGITLLVYLTFLQARSAIDTYHNHFY